MAAGGKAAGYKTLTRYRLLLGQLGWPVVAGCAAAFFLLGAFSCSAWPAAAKGTADPCQGLALGPGAGVPKPQRELVLVTGASGFIGSTLVTQLLGLGYRVRVLDSLETGNLLFLDLRHPRLEFHHGDILDMSAVRRAMQGVVGVFHLAAASKVLPSLKSPKMATFNIERNAVGTSNVLEAANETKLVKKVVYAGSSTYYGNQDVPFVEDDPFVPSSPYAASKYMGELQMLTNDALYKIPTLVLRFFMVYGPRNPSTGAYAIVTGKFLSMKREGKALMIEGTGKQFRDFVHVEDVARACILAYQSSVHGTVINVGAGTSHSIKEAADLVSPNQVHVGPRPHDLKGTLADTCRAKRLLGFSVQKDFRTTMAQMIRDSESGRGDYLAEMWEEPATVSFLQERFPGWSALSVQDRAEQLHGAVRSGPDFLERLLFVVGRRPDPLL